MKKTFLDRVLTPETKASLYWTKAPIYKRILAFFLDLFFVFPIQNIVRGVHPILPVFFVAAYFILLESSKWKGTIGKRVLGLKVEHLNGEKLSIAEAGLRYVVKVFTLAVIGIGYWPLFKNKQAFCDIVISSDVYALTVMK
jgi:uncharacterized RDD family membrane protein YckC